MGVGRACIRGGERGDGGGGGGGGWWAESLFQFMGPLSKREPETLDLSSSQMSWKQNACGIVSGIEAGGGGGGGGARLPAEPR